MLFRSLSKNSKILPRNPPESPPPKGLALGRMGGDLVGNSSVKDVSERGNDGEFVGELIGNVVCEGCL